MIDIGMLALLGICFLSMKWFADWCEKQIKTASAGKGERR